jgi:hypothetical protein
MEHFCSEVLPDMLTKACGVAAPDAARVASDIYLRAEAVAHLNEVDCEILAAPFFEESFTYKPVDAKPWMKAFTTLAVRNSQLEELHANDGPVKASGSSSTAARRWFPQSGLRRPRRTVSPSLGLPLRASPSSPQRRTRWLHDARRTSPGTARC